MKTRLTIAILIAILFPSCTHQESTADVEEWIPLFNGTDLTGWDIKIAGYDVGANPLNTFVVEDSMIRVKYDEYETFGELYGHMYYQEPFSYYRLRFEYRFLGEQTPGGANWNVRNSGVMLHSQSAASNELGQHFPVSVELQMLGGLGEGDRTTANVCTPGTAVEMGDTVNYDHCISSVSQTYHGDQWVQTEAIVLGGEEMIFLIEGDTVLRFQKPQIGGGLISKAFEGQDWEQMGVTRDKQSWLDREGEILTEGYIALQAESHPIDFRNIELLNLCGCMDPKAKNYKSYFVKDCPDDCVY